MEKKKKGTFTTILLVVVMIAGLGLLAYPTVSNWWNSMHASQAVAAYNEAVDDLTDEEYEEILRLAREYNEKMASNAYRYQMSEEEEAEYYNTLDITDTGVMGTIEIPKINVYLPIYHGVSDAVLQVAIGHLPGTSLPIGGESTHAVLSGHRGLPSATLFTHLDKLEEGDTFMIHVMDETVTYEVDQIRTVLPEEVDGIEIEKGKDLVTLETCTPYGVNSHRLLIRGHRVENELELNVAADAMQINRNMVALFIGAPIVIILFQLTLLFSKGK